MKSLITAILASLIFSSTAFAASFVSQAVFSKATSATTATANLRFTAMTPKLIGRDQNSALLQGYMMQAGTTQNFFLTKNITVPTTDVLCAWIQADQDTKIKVNDETAYMILFAGVDYIRCFK